MQWYIQSWERVFSGERVKGMAAKRDEELQGEGGWREEEEEGRAWGRRSEVASKGNVFGRGLYTTGLVV